MSRADAGRARATGFVLAEVIVAMLVLLVGVMASVGLLRLAAFELNWLARAEAARWSAAALADSLVAGVAARSGERTEPWGVLRWQPSGGAVVVEAFDRDPDDARVRSLVRLWLGPAGGDGGAGAPDGGTP